MFLSAVGRVGKMYYVACLKSFDQLQIQLNYHSVIQDNTDANPDDERLPAKE